LVELVLAERGKAAAQATAEKNPDELGYYRRPPSEFRRGDRSAACGRRWDCRAWVVANPGHPAGDSGAPGRPSFAAAIGGSSPESDRAALRGSGPRLATGRGIIARRPRRLRGL